jgi:hypothetical protein
MNLLFQTRTPAFRQYAAVALLFIVLALVVIGKALLLDNCMAFDASDDLNHTFVGMSMAKKMLADGAMPYFNFYNNFGTPLMGDAVTYPFAIQAVPYYLTDINHYPLVMTINRFVLCCATLTALLVFYRTFNISIFASAIGAMCVFFNFGFFWHFAHHHYQATVLFAAIIFIFQRVAIRRNSYKLLFFAVAISSAAMIYSVSANLILLGFIFFTVHPLFYYKPAKAFAVNALALFTGGVLGGVQVITTALAMMNTVRSSKSYAEALFIKFTWPELVLRMLFHDSPSGVHIGHIFFVVYFPLFIILAYLAGLYQYFKAKDHSTVTLSLVLGLLPMLLACFLLVNSGLWKAIPLLKSTDITRLFWIAMIFIGIGIGAFIDAIQNMVVNRRIALLMVIALTLASCVCTIFVLKERSPAINLLGYWSSWLLMVLYYFRSRLTGRFVDEAMGRNLASKWPVISGALVLITIVCTYCPIVYHLGNWENPTACRSVNYFAETPVVSPVRAQLMARISDTGRFAIDFASYCGVELLAGTFGKHGSGARSIAMDGKLQAVLLSKGVIKTDDYLSAYHFTEPWDKAISSRLGLRYFGATEPEGHEGWQLIDKWGIFYIFENLQKPSLVYFSDAQNKLTFIESFRFKGNDMYIDMPKVINGGKLHVTITARPGISVYVDDIRHTFGVDDFGFVCADITPTNKIVRVSYNPLDFNLLFKR